MIKKSLKLPHKKESEDYNNPLERVIQNYLKTGEYDIDNNKLWSGNNYLERAVTGDATLKNRLMNEVKIKVSVAEHKGLTLPSLPPDFDSRTYTRDKVEPMVRAFFNKTEQEPVISLLEKSIIFITKDTLQQVVEDAMLGTAWRVANMYLSSLELEALDGKPFNIVEMNVGSTCYVSMRYFNDLIEDPFCDYIVHETAHIFHNWKRRYASLPEKRKKEWLLEIEFQKRETFAYGCEAFYRIQERLKHSNGKEKQLLLNEYFSKFIPTAANLNQNELRSILQEAVMKGQKSGWKVILNRCLNV